jgi:hypothetical protein
MDTTSRRLGRVLAIEAACVVSLLAAFAPGSAVAAPARLACAEQHGRTIASNKSARVYQNNGKTFGCLYSSNRRVQLGTYGSALGETVGQRNVQLAGRFVAYEEYTEARRLLLYAVRVVDLRLRKRVSVSPTGRTLDFAYLGYGIGPTTMIRLRSTGQVAWIVRDITLRTPRYEVHKHDGRDQLLAAGDDIDPVSLGLIGRTLSWIQAGRRLRATLGPAAKGDDT